MDKIKQVFSHGDKNTSPSGHFSAEPSDRTRESHNTSSTHHSTAETPSYSSAGDRSTTTTGNSTTDRVASKLEDKAAAHTSHDNSTPSHSHSTHGTNAGARTEQIDPSARTIGSTTAATGASGVGAQSGSHIHEHAHPPSHHHQHGATDGLLDEAGAKAATHDHQHLAPVTHETRQRHEVEEIERQREIDRHVHHVQHHVQPVVDTQHSQEVRHEKSVPVTEINERHVASDEGKAQFASLATGHDTVNEAPREKVIVDKGEQVREHTQHHVHHVVQPEIERDVHEHHRTHTVVPVHQTTHEAPIVHESVAHEPLSIKEFTSNGGDLSSKLKHDVNLLNQGECERTVDGPAEQLTESLGLGGNSSRSAGTTRQTTTGQTTGQRAL